MLNELRQKLVGESHRLTLLNADATDLPFEDASFDAILTVHVLHLIPDWRRALAEIRRTLKPGGIYLFSHGSINAQPHEVNLAQKRAEVEQQWKTILAGHATYFEIRQLMQYCTLWQITLIVYQLTVFYEKDVLL